KKRVFWLAVQSELFMYAQSSTVRFALPMGKSLAKSTSTRALAASDAVPEPLALSESAWPAQSVVVPPAEPPEPPVPAPPTELAAPPEATPPVPLPAAPARPAMPPSGAPPPEVAPPVVVAAPAVPPEEVAPAVVALPDVPPEPARPATAAAPPASMTALLGAPSLEQAAVSKVPHTPTKAVMDRLNVGLFETVSTGA